MCKTCKKHNVSNAPVRKEAREVQAVNAAVTRIGDHAVESVGQHVGTRSPTKHVLSHITMGRR